MTTQSSIDLNICVPGQKVRLRSGSIVSYCGLIENSPSSVYFHQLSSGNYASDGCYWLDQHDELDVLEILPLKSTMAIETGIDLNTCVRGQKVKLRDETIATYDGVIDENEIFTHAVNGYSYTKRGTFWMEDDRTSPKDVVEILPIEEEPTKPTPELTHSITDQIDVENPDHVSIIPHEHGVTICIKKGLTTISWRHYNS
jgi:hypothetical protein